jgi:sulfur-oxidizing protein SoxX
MPGAPGRVCARIIGAAVAAAALADAACTAPAVAPPRSLERPLAAPGDAARGRALMLARDPANCVLCHAIPEPALPVAGNLGPPLAGIGRRLTAGEIRLRIVDSTQLNPVSIMPRYFTADGLVGVAPEYRGRAILDAQQIEDLVAYLGTLQ